MGGSFCGGTKTYAEPGPNLPDDGADQIDEEARSGQSGQVVNVGGRIELDKIESCDLRPPAEACDQVYHLYVGEAARRAPPHARHDAGIEAVAVQGDDDPRSFRK